MICLTGDLHHTSLGTGNQKHSDVREIVLASRYLDMLRESGTKVTYFVSGRAFEEEWDDLRAICDDELVEIGGHTYSCFEPELVHRVSKKLCGSYAGPPWLIARDVDRTIDIIRRRTGRTIRAWRNHMYMHGPYTYDVLAKAGIEVCSDVVSNTARGPSWQAAGLIELPINVIPDHEHLFHAERTPEWVGWWQKRYHWRDAFGSDSYYVDAWSDLVVSQIDENEARGALSTIIIHPITMYLCDRFASMRKILDRIRAARTVHVSEVAREASVRTKATLEAWS
jgi:hypothetical protein